MATSLADGTFALIPEIHLAAIETGFSNYDLPFSKAVLSASIHLYNRMLKDFAITPFDIEILLRCSMKKGRFNTQVFG